MIQDKKLITYSDDNLAQYQDTDGFADAHSGSCFEECGKFRVIQGWGFGSHTAVCHGGCVSLEKSHFWLPRVLL